MRIVNRNEFLKLPKGTVYSKYRSLGMFNGLYIKGDTWTNDWIYQDLLEEVECNNDSEFADIMLAAEDGAEFTFDLNCGSRDGAFDDSDMFAIYDLRDLTPLINKLMDAMEEYPVTKEG
jgi:hypothetical protein